MSRAGLDCGSTLIKAYWRADGQDRFATTGGAAPLTDVLRRMRDEGVRTLRIAGAESAGMIDVLRRCFAVIPGGRDAVDEEIRLQAAGTRRLMGDAAPKKLLIASIGTAVSYTVASRGKAKRNPIGNAHGGGTMMGLARLVGARSFEDLEANAAKVPTGDLRVMDKVPETVGTPVGELVMAHFWKKDASFEEKCASVFNLVTCSIAKDLAILASIPFSPKDVAVIGTVSRSPTFRRYLERWAPLLKGRRLHFPPNAEYALAVGAYAAIEP